MNKILKMIVIFCLLILLNIKGIFIIESMAIEYTDEDVETFLNEYGGLSDGGRDACNILKEMGDSELDDIFVKVHDEDFLDAVAQASPNFFSAFEIRGVVTAYRREKKRVNKYNRLNRELNDFPDEYSQENIERLNEMLNELEIPDRDNLDDGEYSYDGEYVGNVVRYLGGMLNYSFNLLEYEDFLYAYDHGPISHLKLSIEAKIEILSSERRYDIPQMNEVQVPIEINTNFYDSSNRIDSDDWNAAKNKVGYVLGAIRNISIVVAVISLMIIGIKYIFGSVEEKANYKQTLWPYFIGILLVTSGTVIVSAIYNAIN